MERYNKEKNNKKLIVILIIFIILSLVIATVQIIRSIPKKELISTKTYDIYELIGAKYDSYYENWFLHYSYIDEQNKINKRKVSEHTLLHKIYLSDKNQVTFEYWGRNGNISEENLTKFYVTDEIYKEISKKLAWDYLTN